ncbi:hypothetical protein QP166_04890 [Sphingomonas sp. LR60]|uniref:hypothetical protein n=1 Tax=Sphingomonas sp. LR60 TaxID=3050233 RepID=UPI002FE00972
MSLFSVTIRNVASKLRVWAIGLTGIVGSIIYFEGESYQNAINEAFHIPAGLIEPSTAEKFIFGVLTLLSHHIVHLILLLALLPIVVGMALMARQVFRGAWKKTTPKWRLRLTEWRDRNMARVRGWLGEPEFHFLTMPVTAAIMVGMVFLTMTASFALIDEGTKAGDDEANRLKEIAKRCSVGRGYIDENPSCSSINLKTGRQVVGLLFNTSGSNLFISDGVRTRVIDLGSVESIADVPGVSRRPAINLKTGKTDVVTHR